MNERIKKLRKTLDLTQAEFASRIGTSANVLTNYETGRRNPSSSVINNICKEFNVNEEWLRNGIGEMFKIAASDTLDALASEYGLSHGDYILIEKFVGMKSESRKLIVDYILEVAAAISYDDTLPDAPAAPYRHPHIDAEVESYRQELEMQEKVAAKSLVSDGRSDIQNEKMA